jgi:hypothetical protein
MINPKHGYHQDSFNQAFSTHYKIYVSTRLIDYALGLYLMERM